MTNMRQLIALAENAPPGEKAKHFIKHHKKDFKKRYGDNWKQVLYSTAWKLFGEHLEEQRIDELTGIKKMGLDDFRKKLALLPPIFSDYQTESIASFANKLYDKGFYPIDAGSFGVVFGHPNLAYVLKIFRLDNAYKAFVMLSMQHRDIANFPKFIGRPFRIDQYTSCVRIEKLEELRIEQWRFIKVVLDYIENKDERPFLDYIKYLFEEKRPQYVEFMQKMLQRNPQFVEAMRIVNSRIGDDAFSSDLREPNFMRRGEVIVVTDPFLDDDILG